MRRFSLSCGVPSPTRVRDAVIDYFRCLIVGLVFLGGGCAWTSDSAIRFQTVKRSQLLMGTLVQITAVGSNEQIAGQAASAGFAEIRRLEGLLSTWISTSEMSHVNAAAGLKPVAVSPETMTILKWSLEIARLTGGAFNIAVGPAVEAWNVVQEPRIPDDAELVRLMPLLDLAQVHLNEEDGTVFLSRPHMRIDVGGIGKGFAADRAVAAMRAAGALAGVVALSGDIKTFGRMPDERGFIFGIRHPRVEGALLARVELQDEAISTAGDYERFFEKDGVMYHHILDPRTLLPARACQSVTIIAREGVMADGLDTGIFILGPERGMELVERLPDVEALIVDRNGKVWISSGLGGRLHMESVDVVGTSEGPAPMSAK
jgi:FAD:protein FMN transferase